MEYTHVVHSIPPLYNEESRILILGSLPSPKSREAGFFYAHPHNRFWKVLARIYERPDFQDVEEKKQFLLQNGIALWDSIYECDIRGASDASIRNVVPTDLGKIIACGKICRIFANGKASGRVFDKYQAKALGREAVTLPSTSPANAAWSLEALVGAWRIVKECAESEAYLLEACPL
ncbi:MAG: DNA-deoxyinosine glycosylase [Lachnospiraceae bacterium]|nr:DNA-deoxyinosine glycosylase [Lachnospiraceae bacterium]